MQEGTPVRVEISSAAASGRYGIVVARFNAFITDPLLDGALAALVANGVDVGSQVTVVHVPGCVEIPIAVLKLAQTGRYDAIVTLGCVIRGGTSHFDYVCQAVFDGVMQASLSTGVPTTLGVLTTDNIEQAQARSNRTGDNKGNEAVLAAMEMVGLVAQIEGD